MSTQITGTGSIIIPTNNIHHVYNTIIKTEKCNNLETNNSPHHRTKTDDSRNIQEFLKEKGFNTYESSNGSIIITDYHHKADSEKIIIEKIAPYVNKDSLMEWHDEYGRMWRWIFTNGQLIEQKAIITWV